MVFVPEAMIRIGPVDPVPAVPDPGIIPGWRNINDVRVERRRIEGFGRCLDHVSGRAIRAGVPSDRAARNRPGAGTQDGGRRLIVTAGEARTCERA